MKKTKGSPRAALLFTKIKKPCQKGRDYFTRNFCPTRITFAFLMLFNFCSVATVVLCFAAICDNVSPFFTVYICTFGFDCTPATALVAFSC